MIPIIEDKSIEVRIVTSEEGFYSLSSAWNNLLSISVSNSYFMRWEWLWSWWKAYKTCGNSLCIILIFRNTELIGIAPLYREKYHIGGIFPVRCLLFLGTKEGSVISEYMDFLCKKKEHEIVIRSIVCSIINLNLADEISLHKIDTSSNTLELLHQLSVSNKFHYAIKGEYESPYVNLPDDQELLLAGLESSFRQKIRNNMRRLNRHPDVSFRKTKTISTFEADFDELVRLHQLRWEARNMPGSFSNIIFKTFQKEAMKEMLANGHLDLWFLSAAGENIGAVYNIIYEGRICFYQSGIDVSFDKTFSPGVLLHYHCMGDAITRGLSEYDFMLKGKLDSYKGKWTKNCRVMKDVKISMPAVLIKYVQGREFARSFYHRLKPYIKGEAVNA